MLASTKLDEMAYIFQLESEFELEFKIHASTIAILQDIPQKLYNSCPYYKSVW